MKLRQALLALLMASAGAMHFLKTAFYVKIVPDFLPNPRLLVELSGAAAILLGVLMLWKPVRNLAVYGTIAYFVAVFPANLYMAFHSGLFPSIPAWAAWVRLPLQGVLIYWAYRCRETSGRT